MGRAWKCCWEESHGCSLGIVSWGGWGQLRQLGHESNGSVGQWCCVSGRNSRGTRGVGDDNVQQGCICSGVVFICVFRCLSVVVDGGAAAATATVAQVWQLGGVAVGWGGVGGWGAGVGLGEIEL